MLKLTKVFRKNAAAYKEMQDGHKKYKYIINQGGSRSSKTFSILQLLVEIARKYPLQIDIAGISTPHLKMGVLNDMPKVMDTHGINFHDMFRATDKKLVFESGGSINFIALDKLGSAHGGARDILYINEANHHKYPIVEQLMLRTAICTFIDFNPTSRFWAHDIAANNPDDAILIKSTYKDNEFCPPNIVEFIESKKGDGTNNFWRVYGLGEIGVSEGLVFDAPEIMDFDRYGFDKYFNGLDWGFSNDPFAFVRCAVDRGVLYICDEICEKGLLNKDSAPLLKPLVRNEAVFCDSAEPKSIAEYKSLGINARAAKKGAGSIESGIKKIQSFEKVVIHEDCVHTINEFNNYQWKKDKSGEALPQPVDAFNHCIDAIRYALEVEMRYRKKEYDVHTNPYEENTAYSGDGWMG